MVGIRKFRVQAGSTSITYLLALASFARSLPEFKSSVMLVNSQLVASCQLERKSCYILFGLFVSNYLSGVEWSACNCAEKGKGGSLVCVAGV